MAHLKILVSVDEILGYTCISKTKVNMIKEIEETYSRKQLYNCIKNNKEEIKRYLDEKCIYDEYGKLSYIFACIKNKIKDDAENINILATNNSNSDEIVFETDEQVLLRLNKENQIRDNKDIFDILNKLKGDR